MYNNIINILKRGVKNGLRVNGLKTFNYRITMSGHIRNLTGYIDTVITIDHQELNVYTHNSFRRGYLHYYHFDSKEIFDKEIFDNNKKIIYDLYLPVDDVLDNKEFFTTSIIEQRKLKIQQLKEKIKKS